MFRCADGRLHATQAEADACLHHPLDKDFDSVNPDHPSCSGSASKKRAAPAQVTFEDNTEGDDDHENDLPTAPPPPETPAPRVNLRSVSRSPSPLSQQQGYPTPPFSQDVEEDVGDNINVAMASSSQMASSSPAAVVRRRSPKASPFCGAERPSSSSNRGTPIPEDEEDTDDFPGPQCSSQPPPVRSPSPAQSASAAGTSRVPETVPGAAPINTQQANEGDAAATPDQMQSLNNEILALRADRARLTDALSSSTFQIRNLITRSKLSLIELRLARREADATRAQSTEAWELVDVARESRQNAWVSFWIVVGMVLAYWTWCWYNSVEIAYIRSRRCWVYGLEGSC